MAPAPFLPFITLSIIHYLHSTNARPICTHGYVERYKWESNDMFQTVHTPICCKHVSCKPGTYVVKCTNDGEEDKCQPCPPGTHLLDNTSSTNAHDCVQYSCPSGSVTINRYSETGCHKPCACDTDSGFYGHDSCNCKVYQGSCPVGTHLTQNGSCASLRDRGTSHKYFSFTTNKEISSFSVSKERDIVQTSVIIEKQDSSNSTHLEVVQSSSTFLYAVKVSVTVLVVALIMVLALLLYKRCRKRSSGNDSNREQRTIAEKTSMSSQDSGISADLNQETELKEMLVFEDRKPLTQVGVVRPRLHDNLEPEAASLIPCSPEEGKPVGMMLISGSRREYSV